MSRILRASMWWSIAFALIFQAAFLVELHSPQTMDEVSWSLFGLSVACFATFLYSRATLTSLRKWKR